MLLPRALRRVASVRPAVLRSASTAAAVQDATAAVVQKPPPDPKTVADMRRPEWWYPKARLSKRTIIYHGGPTNSGKTYHALEALKRAENGVYAGPLRLLALEVHERLNDAGVYCSLFTGQERREVPFATHASSTIEMVSLQERYDVAVIDEIQLIGSSERGHSWTRALLGLDAREIHVCGALDASELVEDLAKKCGDDFVLKTYERLTPLKPLPVLKGWRDVRAGDCVVTFSRDDIHAVKRLIEEAKPGTKCCVVYGTLPPETRAEQARLFNTEGNGYDVLVASDAIGMGLNLNIGRVLFRRVLKYAGNAPSEARLASVAPEYRDDARRLGQLPADRALVKQIAGRAGRMSTAFGEGGGGVAAMDERDAQYVRKALNAKPDKVTKAGLFPPSELLAAFARETKISSSTPVTAVVDAFVNVCQIDAARYALAGHVELKKVATQLDVPLPLEDMVTFCAAPCNSSDRLAVAMLTEYARARSRGERAGPNVRLPKHKPRTLRDLHDMCGKHNVLDCYLWLAHRFPETFPESDAAMAQKRRCIGLVAAGLASRRLQLPEKKEADAKLSVAAKLVAAKKKKPSAKKRGRVVRGKRSK
jgi:ATP-dependent RNA helicase SUPV3L1/SUV3